MDFGEKFKKELQQVLDEVSIKDFSYSEDPEAYRIEFWISYYAAHRFFVEKGGREVGVSHFVNKIAHKIFENVVKGPIRVRTPGNERGRYPFRVTAFKEGNNGTLQ